MGTSKTGTPSKVIISGNTGTWDSKRLLHHYGTTNPNKVRNHLHHLTQVELHPKGTIMVFHHGLFTYEVRTDLKQLSRLLTPNTSMLLFGFDITTHDPLMIELYNGRYQIVPYTIQVYYGQNQDTNRTINRLKKGPISVAIPNDSSATNRSVKSNNPRVPPLWNVIEPQSGGVDFTSCGDK